MPYKSKYKGKNGLLIPINLDDVLLLSILDSNVLISATNISKQSAFPTKSINNFDSVLKFRENAVALGALNTISNNSSLQTGKSQLPLPGDAQYSEQDNFKMKMITSDRNHTSMPKSKQKLFYKKEKNNFDKTNYNMLSPTLSDFLTDIKKDKENI